MANRSFALFKRAKERKKSKSLFRSFFALFSQKRGIRSFPKRAIAQPWPETLGSILACAIFLFFSSYMHGTPPISASHIT